MRSRAEAITSTGTTTMAVTSIFSPGAGILTTFGDNLDNTITLSRNAAGKILVNGGAVAVMGGTPTVANTDQDPGVRPGRQRHHHPRREPTARCRAPICSAAPATTRSSAARATTCCSARAATTRCSARAAFDFLFGGAGNDMLTGGDADDQMFGEAGDDRMIWNPGDDTDLYEGGAGNDTSRSQRRQRRRGLHGHGQRHARALRPPRSGAVLDRHRHHREPRRQHERRRRLVSAPPATSLR